MKTIREHFEKLPEPYRSQAIGNTPDERLIMKCDNAAQALFKAFSWQRTPQGEFYWTDLYIFIMGIIKDKDPKLTPEQVAKFDLEFKQWAEANLEE